MEAQAAACGGVTAPRGFKAAGVHAGLKPNRPDMALIYSEAPAAAAGVFTSNRVKAAPVRLDARKLRAGRAQAVIINSGNANACTGRQGAKDAARMADLTAAALRINPALVCVCSTGTIGRPLPMDVIAAGITRAAGDLDAAHGARAARAIMTTDTRPKEAVLRLEIDGQTVTLGGMAKGSGMISPNMATMLGFITTDAAVEPRALRAALRQAVRDSFNCITVDGDQSTNDTVICLANGRAGNRLLQPGHRCWRAFCRALSQLALELALMIVKDGEGATKLVTVTVRNAASRSAALCVARAVAQSPLVKTSWFGADPNWGRVICAIGYAGVPVRPEKIDIAYNGLPAVSRGQSAGLSESDLHAVIRRPEFSVEIDLHQGRAVGTIYTCDYSDQYIAINADYMT
ncbi:MAG: bifunctional glutamate N-acetyltransferase/amino-acid acetyltransferase ArgJ [Kiritimatiellia bacterium]|nr:bifunctional glutamate N-acetyltransferase/amino-acid acetyltransferase ArgJ [Lentisphaerota bacterium]